MPEFIKLSVEPIVQGGFLVRGVASPGLEYKPLFASTDLRDALDFIHDRLGPKPESIGEVPDIEQIKPEHIIPVHPAILDDFRSQRLACMCPNWGKNYVGGQIACCLGAKA